jgi:hypothetical protein
VESFLSWIGRLEATGAPSLPFTYVCRRIADLAKFGSSVTAGRSD